MYKNVNINSEDEKEKALKLQFSRLFTSVCERIRTLDLLVRSQTLYPAELHTLIVDRRGPIYEVDWEDPVYTRSAHRQRRFACATLLTVDRRGPSDEVGF